LHHEPNEHCIHLELEKSSMAHHEETKNTNVFLCSNVQL
jgi:hypothetical protein